MAPILLSTDSPILMFYLVQGKTNILSSWILLKICMTFQISKIEWEIIFLKEKRPK